MKSLRIPVLVLFTALSVGALAYDSEMAAKIQPVAAKLSHEGLVKGGCKISPEDLLKLLTEKKEKVTLLDVRTPAEARIVGLTYPNTLHIPMDQLFKEENLKRLPTDGKIVVVCHSGNRAAGSTALLSAIGFKNVVYVNGGLISLVTNLTPLVLPVE
jgi:rhodanese-related sulfurtransferase